MKYLHNFFAEYYLSVPLKDREGKLPHKRAQRCKFFAYSYTTIIVPTYIELIVTDNGTYGNTHISKDVIFDESVVFSLTTHIDNSHTNEEFVASADMIENINEGLHEQVKKVRFADDNGHEQVHIPECTEFLDIEPIRRNISPQLELYTSQDYKDTQPDDEERTLDSEDDPGVDEYGMPVYWSKITRTVRSSGSRYRSTQSS